MSKCCKCEKTRNQATLFRFPCNEPERCAEWLWAVKITLKPSEDDREIKKLRICEDHFEQAMILASSTRKMLTKTAKPTKLSEQKEPVAENATRKDVGVFVDTLRPDKELKEKYEAKLARLKFRIRYLRKRLSNLRNDPPASHIYKHRAKLREYLAPKAYVMFECSLRNGQRKGNGRRYTKEERNLADQISYRSTRQYQALKEWGIILPY